MPVTRKLNTEIIVYASRSEMPEHDKALLQAATMASERAYAPYSQFYVGAAVMFEDGTVVEGNNQENAAYPSGLCAERVALFYASSKHPAKKIKAIAITARSARTKVDAPVSPCGSCRQAIAEYEAKAQLPIRIIMSGETGEVFEAASIGVLLPLTFSKESFFKE